MVDLGHAVDQQRRTILCLTHKLQHLTQLYVAENAPSARQEVTSDVAGTMVVTNGQKNDTDWRLATR